VPVLALSAVAGGQVAYNATAGTLAAGGLNCTLECPSAVQISWSWAGAAAPGVAARGAAAAPALAA
jgi:hypothetical protein